MTLSSGAAPTRSSAARKKAAEGLRQPKSEDRKMPSKLSFSPRSRSSGTVKQLWALDSRYTRLPRLRRTLSVAAAPFISRGARR